MTNRMVGEHLDYLIQIEDSDKGYFGNNSLLWANHDKKGDLFKKLPEKLKSNKELALQATKRGASLTLFNSDLQNEPEIIALVKK
jgi:hypothetical protein